ncbi:GM10072 [Drosophila sechellia]|uniref:GM10072 n=1 Tax=Drosophila sechellia TaxID=7238 RepID=B4ILR7_DROSE|nr:GM10072 [Drosophila sechellia]
MWTDDYTHRNFISLTAHYVDESFKLQVALLGIKEFTDDEKAGENIINNVKKMVED